MRVARGRRDRGVRGIRVDREEVERRIAEPARAECGAEVLDEPGRRVRRPRAAGVVPAVRGQRPADHRDVRACRLDERVGRLEQPEVRGRGGVRAVPLELRHPERVRVRLVSEADHPELRDPSEDRRGVGAELHPVAGRYRRVARERVDRDDRPDPEQTGGVDRRAEPNELRVVRGRLGPAPDRAEHDRPEPGPSGQLHVPGWVAPLGRVLDAADDEPGTSAFRPGHERDRGAGGCDQQNGRDHRATHHRAFHQQEAGGFRGGTLDR